MDIDRDLIEQAADQHGVSPDVLLRLLGLSDEFPDMTAWGAKTRLLGRVSEIIDDAVKAYNA